MKHNQDFLFLRHGQTDWNLQDRFQGQQDIPLNATGLQQAEEAALILSGRSIDRIVSSPMLRALKTAAIVAEKIDLPVHIDSRLTERSFGSFDGLVVAEVKKQHGIAPDEPAAAILPPNAEQWPETCKRSTAAVERWLVKCPDETILFVAHHGIFRGLMETLTGRLLESKNGVPYDVRWVEGNWEAHQAK